MTDYSEMTIGQLINEFGSVDEDEIYNNNPIRTALSNAIHHGNIDVIDRLFKECNLKFENHDLNHGLFRSIEMRDVENLKYWLSQNACPTIHHLEEVLIQGVEEENEEILSELISFLKKNKNIVMLNIRLIKQLCEIQLLKDKILNFERSKDRRDYIIRKIAKLIINPTEYYSAEMIYNETTNDNIDYQKILEFVKHWEWDGYDDEIQKWIRK